jgi:anti-anti-sigma factor
VGAFEEAVEAVEVVVGDPVVVVDLRAVTFMDSSALHVLLRAAQRLGSRLHLVPGPPHVNRVFELTATWERFEFVDPSVVDVSDDERDG